MRISDWSSDVCSSDLHHRDRGDPGTRRDVRPRQESEGVRPVRAANPVSDEHTLFVVMNGRVVGDINRTGKNKARMRYEDAAADDFTPLSVSMPGPTGRYRETVLVPWVEAMLPDRTETLRQWRRRFGVTEQGALALMTHVGEDVAGAAQFVRPSRLAVVQIGRAHV